MNNPDNLGYNQKIDTLLDQQLETADERTLFFSTYQSLSGEIKSNKIAKHVKTSVKSALFDQLHDHPLTAKLEKLPQKIWSKLERKLNKIENFHSGLAVFVKLDRTKQKPVKINLVPLVKKVDRKTYLGPSYDLGQLIWIANLSALGLILNLRQKKATIYLLKNDQLEKLEEVENEFLDTKVKDLGEYIEKYNFDAGKQTYYGTGSNKVDDERTFANRLFLDKIHQIISEQEKLRVPLEFLVIFYSYSFTPFIKKFADQTPVKVKLTPLLIARNIADEKEIKESTLRNIRHYQKQQKKQIINQAKEMSELFITEWSEILKESRQNKIDTLFVKPNVEKPGYLHQKKYLFLESYNNSVRINNIVPWLIKSVMETNGDVILVKENALDSQIAAKLRFK